jgi:hypothetical protein
MRQTKSSLHPALRSIVAEATEALARLDADRLEELVLNCQKLNREFSPHPESFSVSATSNLLAQGIPSAQSCLPVQSEGGALPEMAVFSRLLSLTRENLAVLTRARVQKNAQLEYSDRETGLHWAELEVNNGDNK